MAALSLALPTAARWLRPNGASASLARSKTGGLAQGPEEKRGFAGTATGFVSGRAPGFCIAILLPFQISAPRWGGVSHGGDYARNRPFASAEMALERRLSD